MTKLTMPTKVATSWTANRSTLNRVKKCAAIEHEGHDNGITPHPHCKIFVFYTNRILINVLQLTIRTTESSKPPARLTRRQMKRHTEETHVTVQRTFSTLGIHVCWISVPSAMM